MSSDSEDSITENSPLPTGKPSTVVNKPVVTEKMGGKTRRVIKYGSRRKVFNGTAEKTRGGLRKDDLIKNGRGRIVSRKRVDNAKKRFGLTE